jgi:hypothetical protein
LLYSGKLLREAHAVDGQAFRSYTLYSTLFTEDGEDGSQPPDPAAAKAYLREFPRGPFAIHANLALARFYEDLFRFIGIAIVDDSVDFFEGCYRRYVGTTPLAQQRLAAQRAAVGYYERLTQLLPQSVIMGKALAGMRKGESEGWNFCGD